MDATPKKRVQFELIVKELYDNLPKDFFDKNIINDKETFRNYLKIRGLGFNHFKQDGKEILVPTSFNFEKCSDKQFKIAMKKIFRKLYDKDLLPMGMKDLMHQIVNDYDSFFKWINK